MLTSPLFAYRIWPSPGARSMGGILARAAVQLAGQTPGAIESRPQETDTLRTPQAMKYPWLQSWRTATDSAINMRVTTPSTRERTVAGTSAATPRFGPAGERKRASGLLFHHEHHHPDPARAEHEPQDVTVNSSSLLQVHHGEHEQHQDAGRPRHRRETAEYACQPDRSPHHRQQRAGRQRDEKGFGVELPQEERGWEREEQDDRPARDRLTLPTPQHLVHQDDRGERGDGCNEDRRSQLRADHEAHGPRRP